MKIDWHPAMNTFTDTLINTENVITTFSGVIFGNIQAAAIVDSCSDAFISTICDSGKDNITQQKAKLCTEQDETKRA